MILSYNFNLILYSIVYIILNFICFYHYFFVKTLLIILLLFCIKKLFKNFFKKKELSFESLDEFSKKFKINNKFINWFWIFLYIFFFIIIIFYIRIHRIGFKIDLRPLKNFLINSFLTKNYFIIILLFLIIILFLIIFAGILKKLKIFFKEKFLKQHLFSIQIQQDFSLLLKEGKITPYIVYLHEHTKDYSEMLKKNENLYIKFYILFYNISAIKIRSIYNKLSLNLYIYFENKNLIFLANMLYPIKRFFYRIANPVYIMFSIPLIIAYDLYFNNFILVHIFYFLPFFFIYVLWYNISEFFYQTRIPPLERIIYEMIYEFPKVMYFDLDEEQSITIAEYILNDLQKPQGIPGNDFSISIRILNQCRYLYEEKSKLYKNHCINDYYHKEK